MNSNKNQRAAFSLVELLVSLAIVVTVMVPIMSSFANISRAQYLKIQKESHKFTLSSIMQTIEKSEEENKSLDEAVYDLRIIYKDFMFSQSVADIKQTINISSKDQSLETIELPYLYREAIIL